MALNIQNIDGSSKEEKENGINIDIIGINKEIEVAQALKTEKNRKFHKI